MKKIKVSVVKTVPNIVNAWKNVLLQIIFLPFGFAKNVLQSVFLFWHKYRAIILNLPTGRGKTTFIVDCILNYAISHNMRVLIVSNRISLDTAIKKQISKILGLYEDYPDNLLRKTDDFGLVTITTYQKLPTYLKNKDFCKSISYAVFDEAHYFTSDASFSELTEWVLKKIPEKFSEAVRIYMSATINEVSPYICQAECNQKAIERWHLRFNTDKFFKDWLIRIKNPAIRERYPEITQMLAEDSVYAPYYPTPKIYKMKADYSNVQLKFYSDSSIIKDVIDRSDSKSVVFVANKKMGKELSEEIENSAYMNAEINNKNPELMNRIIETESFDEKVLITTSVFCNGCNICDENVKNVFIECLDQTDILQMAGRKRKLSENDTYTLYLRIPDLNTLKYYIQKSNDILTSINLGQKDNDSFINLSFDNNHFIDSAQKIVYSHENKLRFNQIAIDKLNNQVLYYENLLELINKKGIEGYCKMIAKELFGKRFTPDMLAENHDYYAETCAWLETYLNIPLNEESFSQFSVELLRQIKLFNRSLKERSDRILGKNALNKRLSDNNFPFQITNTEQKGTYVLRSTLQNL